MSLPIYKVVLAKRIAIAVEAILEKTESDLEVRMTGTWAPRMTPAHSAPAI